MDIGADVPLRLPGNGIRQQKIGLTGIPIKLPIFVNVSKALLGAQCQMVRGIQGTSGQNPLTSRAIKLR